MKPATRQSTLPVVSHGFERLRAAGIAALGVAALFYGSPAGAHDAIATAAQPQGWSYPFSCCSGIDCREMPAKQVSERPEGYVIAGTGELVGYGDKRIKNSPDGEFHWCSVEGKNDSKTICLFVPPRAY